MPSAIQTKHTHCIRIQYAINSTFFCLVHIFTAIHGKCQHVVYIWVIIFSAFFQILVTTVTHVLLNCCRAPFLTKIVNSSLIKRNRRGIAITHKLSRRCNNVITSSPQKICVVTVFLNHKWMFSCISAYQLHFVLTSSTDDALHAVVKCVCASG